MNKEAKDSLFDQSMVFEDCAIEAQLSQCSYDSSSLIKKFESREPAQATTPFIKGTDRFGKPSHKDRHAEGLSRVRYMGKKQSPTQEKRGLTPGKNQSSNSKMKHPAISRFPDKENMPLLVSKVRKVEELKKNSTQTKEGRYLDKAEQLFQWRDAKDKKVERIRKESDLELARSRSKKRLSSRELAKSSERLYETAFMLEKKKEITAKASNEFSFKPQINPKSIEMVKNQHIRYTRRAPNPIPQSKSTAKLQPKQKPAGAINRSKSKESNVRLESVVPHSKKLQNSLQAYAHSPSLDLLEEDQHVFCTTQDECEESASVNQEMKIEGAYDSEPKASDITETEEDLEYVSTIQKMHQLRYDGDISVDVYEDHRQPRQSNTLELSSSLSASAPVKEFSFMMPTSKEQNFSKKPKQLFTTASGKREREASVERKRSRESSIRSGKSRSIAIIPTDIGELSLENSCSADKQQLSSPVLQAKADKREVLAAIDLGGSFSSKKPACSNLRLQSDKKQPAQQPFAEKKQHKQRDLLEIMRNLCQDVDNTMQSKNN